MVFLDSKANWNGIVNFNTCQLQSVVYGGGIPGFHEMLRILND